MRQSLAWHRRFRHLLSLGARRVIPIGALWWVLTGGEAASWLIGLPVVLGAACAMVVLHPGRRWQIQPTALIRFIPYFAWRSLAGGVDVAWRAIRPGLPIAPSFQSYRLRLPSESPARIFLVNAISLQPGTLSADLRGDSITIHVLSGGPDVLGSLERLEQRVAALFAEPLSDPHDPHVPGRSIHG